MRVLPAALREISGLAFHRGVLLAHDDEIGRIYSINPVTGAVAIFATLRGPIHDDFEGIAVLRDTVWLMTSSGTLYGVKATASSAPVAFALHQTGLGKRCELEGLAADSANGVLLLPCKTLPKNGRGVVVYRWNLAQGARRDSRDGERGAGRPQEGGRAGRASQRDRGRARHRSPAGTFIRPPRPARVRRQQVSPVGALRLPRRHAQPEGLALAANGDIFVSDEGGNGAGTLAIYRCHP